MSRPIPTTGSGPNPSRRSTCCARSWWSEAHDKGLTMRILTTLPQRDLRLVAEAARTAEARGFDGVITLENRHEPFLALGVAATATERLSLATGVAIAFPRSPMVTASTAWDLQVASRGRFVLGL